MRSVEAFCCVSPELILLSIMFEAPRLLPVALVVSVLILTGCRTYGDEGFESESKMYGALQESVQQIERSLQRSESDLQRLQAAAERDDRLEGHVRQYRSLLQSHQMMAADHAQQAERLSGDASYRTLHRVYGAMITDQKLLQQKYRRALRGIWATVRDTTIPRPSARLPSRYSITPVQYPRVDRRIEITMAEALRGVDGAPGLQREEQAPGE